MMNDIKNFRELVDSMENRHDRIAMMERRNEEFKEITYEQITEIARNISFYLRNKNIKKPDRVAILSTNRMEWGITYFGITYGGNIAVPIDPKLKKNEIEHILKFSESRAVFTEERFIPLLREISDDSYDGPIITLDNSEEENFNRINEEMKNRRPENYEESLAEISPDHTASIIFTSGTTGVSKAVELTHYNFIFDTVQSEKLLNLMPDEVFLSVLPIHHTFEFTGGFLEPMMKGNTICYARSLKSSELLQDLKDSKATMILGVPLLFEKIYTGIKRELEKQNMFKKGLVGLGLSLGNLSRKIKKEASRNFITGKVLKTAGLDSLRVLISGGAALDPDVEIGLRALGLNIIQGYGLTEASPIVTINPVNSPRVGSIGKPIPGIQVDVHQPNKKGTGEIIVKGDNVMKGYYKNPEDTSEKIKNGWLYTGDMGYIDSDGYLFITGRKKSIIVTDAGKNIYPEEIEYLLNKSKYIEEVLVTEMYSKDKGKTELTALIYPSWEEFDEYIIEENKNESAINELLKEEINKVNDKLASYKRIVSFRIREEEFPKTSTRKIKRYLFEEKNISVND